MSTLDWLAEMEIADATFLDGAKLLDDLTPQQLAASFEDELQQLYSLEGFCIDLCSNTSTTTISSSSPEVEVPQVYCETPTKKSIPEAASFSDLASLHKLSSKNNRPQWDRSSVGSEQARTLTMETTKYASQKHAPKAERGCKRGFAPSSKSPNSKEHVIAERKRRAKLSQQFIALTALVPGIKKIDKATVLEDTIKYLKQLQERVQILEEQNSTKTMESAVFVKKFQIYSDGESCSSDENFTDEPQPLPQIEARISDRNVLIRIQCEKRNGTLTKALAETEKHNLHLVNSSVIPFGDSTMDITLMAQMKDGFNMTVKDLVKSLRSSLTQSMGKDLPYEHED